jgi:hypothetical protein
VYPVKDLTCAVVRAVSCNAIDVVCHDPEGLVGDWSLDAIAPFLVTAEFVIIGLDKTSVYSGLVGWHGGCFGVLFRMWCA